MCRKSGDSQFPIQQKRVFLAWDSATHLQNIQVQYLLMMEICPSELNIRKMTSNKVTAKRAQEKRGEVQSCKRVRKEFGPNEIINSK